MGPDGTMAYIINSLAWSIVGAAMVLIYQRLRDWKSGSIPIKWPRPNWVVIISVVVLIIAVANAVLGWQIDRRQREFVACQAHVNQVRTEALDRLQRLAAEDRLTVDVMVQSVVESDNRETTLKALTKYLADRKDTEIHRGREGPLPQPEDLCGPPPRG